MVHIFLLHLLLQLAQLLLEFAGVLLLSGPALTLVLADPRQPFLFLAGVRVSFAYHCTMFIEENLLRIKGCHASSYHVCFFVGAMSSE